MDVYPMINKYDTVYTSFLQSLSIYMQLGILGNSVGRYSCKCGCSCVGCVYEKTRGPRALILSLT